MNIPKDLFYSDTHEWVKFLDDGAALIGLDDYAQHALSDLVFITLPSEGDEVTAGEAFGDVESVKAVSDIFCQVTGVVDEINEDVDNTPGLINQDPYGSWIIKVKDITEKADLMDAAAYEKYCAELETEEE
jgi:glycine cleavage system H protein